jgi:2-polyprenyl-3-methyl-5-hydroxy-6-metoxy-1,4-benzoquinol methylase
MKNRSTEKEKMHDLSIHGETLHNALQSLAWINRWFGNHGSVVNTITYIDKKEIKTRSIIDLGCSGGNLILELKRPFKKNEWISILKEAGIVSYNLQNAPIFRILLSN